MLTRINVLEFMGFPFQADREGKESFLRCTDVDINSESLPPFRLRPRIRGAGSPPKDQKNAHSAVKQESAKNTLEQ
jgi:hypothetical protein